MMTPLDIRTAQFLFFFFGMLYIDRPREDIRVPIRVELLYCSLNLSSCFANFLCNKIRPLIYRYIDIPHLHHPPLSVSIFCVFWAGIRRHNITT